MFGGLILIAVFALFVTCVLTVLWPLIKFTLFVVLPLSVIAVLVCRHVKKSYQNKPWRE